MKSFLQLSNRPEVQNASRLQLIKASATAIDYMLVRWEEVGYVPFDGFDDFVSNWYDLRDYAIQKNKTSMKAYDSFEYIFKPYRASPIIGNAVDKFLRISFYPMKKNNAFYILFSGLLVSVKYCIEMSTGDITVQDRPGKVSEEEFRLVQIVKGEFGL